MTGADLLLGDRPSAVRAAAMRLRASLAELPVVAVGLKPADWRIQTTEVRVAAGDVLGEFRALRANDGFRLLLERVDEAATEADCAIQVVRTSSLPRLLEEIGTLVNPSVAVRDRNAAASRFHLPVDDLVDDLDRLIRSLDRLDELDAARARLGGEAGT